jgi:metallo-beta-lactamase family protein
MKITFLGATETVTGSKFLVASNTDRIMVDCGLFQGYKHLRRRNRRPLPFDPSMLDAVVLTHAHIDHSGYLPLLAKNGFSGPVYCTKTTHHLCEILLPDSGRIHEEDAAYANKKGFSSHKPAKPLYTEEDALNVLTQFTPVEYGQSVGLGEKLNARFMQAGHILGASLIQLNDGESKLLFSGDLGRPNDPLMHAPETGQDSDFLILESTYGKRKHGEQNAQEELAEVVNRTVNRGGLVLIPSFAVGRAQLLLYHLQQLMEKEQIPEIPVFLDSPMAVKVTDIFYKSTHIHRLEPEECEKINKMVTFTSSVEESKAINRQSGPRIIVSASGMATGGRVLHHLKHYAGNEQNTILFAGYQAGGTRGAKMLAGVSRIKIHGRHVPVRAEVTELENLSAHADYQEILDWLKKFKSEPEMTFLVHGSPESADNMRLLISDHLGWDCRVAEYKSRAELKPGESQFYRPEIPETHV